MANTTQRLFGLDFESRRTVAQVAEDLLNESHEVNGWRCVVTPNVDHLVRYERFAVEAEAGRSATVVLPDGAPIVWASRLLGRPLARRLTGADLFDVLWPRLVEGAIPTVVVASSVAVAERMSREHPALATTVAPMFEVDDVEQIARLVEETDHLVASLGAKFVVVGISMPKHHRVANGLRQRWANRSDLTLPTVLLLGAAPEFTLGFARRAPGWMQRTGLEWLHRLYREPRRMARRYLVDDPTFLRLVWQDWRSDGRKKEP